VFFDLGDAVSDIFCGVACHPRQAILLLQLFIPAWIGGNLGALYFLFHELLERVRKGHFAVATKTAPAHMPEAHHSR
jgi:hypothetical protein